MVLNHLNWSRPQRFGVQPTMESSIARMVGDVNTLPFFKGGGICCLLRCVATKNYLNYRLLCWMCFNCFNIWFQSCFRDLHLWRCFFPQINFSIIQKKHPPFSTFCENNHRFLLRTSPLKISTIFISEQIHHFFRKRLSNGGTGGARRAAGQTSASRGVPGKATLKAHGKKWRLSQ